MTEVFLNNKYVGKVTNGKEFVSSLLAQRRGNKLPSSVSMYYNEGVDQVFLETCSGRVIRPLVVIKNGKTLLTEAQVEKLEKGELKWQDLVSQGIIEYLDTNEEESALVALRESDITQDHTHLEISPIDIFGLTSSLVPFGNYNQGVRLTQGSKNQKQAVGFYAANFYSRMDMDVNLLHYPQKPIVTTITNQLLRMDEHPTGQNVVVAIMSYQGYNMQDAIVINKGSIDRGFGRSTYFRPVISEELRYSGGLSDEVGVPDKDVKGYRTEHDYRFLEDDGMIYPEAVVAEGDVIIGKTSPPRFLSSLEEYNLAQTSRRESSMALKHGEHGVVDQVLLTESEEGNKLVQVRLREQRIPEIGDKFTSRHGQKGVISLIVPEADIPFTSGGIKPDILFSPHGIPSRMTVSHLIELLSGKVGALSGRYVDGTTFEGEQEEDLRAELLRMGFRENGTETLYNGITGGQYNAKIYIGNMYYIKLKHMVANKIHSRARGPIQLLTRQPTEGRAKEGGLRLGEMEKDTFVAHGASLLLKERFDSDKTEVPICEGCGLVAIHDARKNSYFCPTCGENVEISNIEMSYAFKLLLDEFKSLTLFPKLKLISQITKKPSTEAGAPAAEQKAGLEE
ncbi:DNA-directed RNA polymerase subunit B [Candidatus Woesearchaeota archaeon]|nr:DNA-directed RNA polymerase subunit B [Candidatus Woesearchaeota archaeon]